MANDNHLLSVPCYNGTMLKQDYYNEFFELGQQKINFSFFELCLPDDDPVYTLKKVMEDLDFSGLLANCSNKGRTGFNPIMMYAVVTYANMRGVRAVDRIVELCERDLAFIWLTKGQKPKRDAFYEFKNKKLTADVLDELNYQFLRRLQKEGLITLKSLFIDGTKIEANANRYTFVWRGTLNYHLAGLLDTIDSLYQKYFIVQAYVSNDRTDYNTLIPVLEKHKNAFGEILEEVTADSGYCSEKNLLYLRDHKITSYIKLQDHEKRKTCAHTEDIGKYYNMKTQIFEDELYYVCHDGRELHHIRTEKKEQSGYTQTFEVYGCADCSGCGHKAKCFYKYNAEKDAEKNKVMKINEQWEVLKEESHANIQSGKGILNRQIRSIQTEGHFGDIKENDGFRRFNYRTAEKVYKEFMLYAIGRNINKYHRFLHDEIKKFEGKTEEKTA